MRSFRPHTVTKRTSPDSFGLTKKFSLFEVNSLNPDFPVAVILWTFWRRTSSNIPGSAVIIKKQRWVNSFCTLNDDRIRPGAFRIISRNKKVSDFIYLSTNAVKLVLMIADSWRKKSARNSLPGKIQLFRAVNYITNLFPGNKIMAPENRQPRNIRKRRTYKIVVSASLTNGRVRIKTRKNRINNSCSHKTFLNNRRIAGILCDRQSHCEPQAKQSTILEYYQTTSFFYRRNLSFLL